MKTPKKQLRAPVGTVFMDSYGKQYVVGEDGGLHKFGEHKVSKKKAIKLGLRKSKKPVWSTDNV